MIKHIHSKQCLSTQSTLANFEHSQTDTILVSTEEQTSGIGRRGSSWIQYSNALAMSFLLPANDPITILPLEIGVLLCNFIQEKFGVQLKLKWPNDLIILKGFKAGGIIIQNSKYGQMIVGVGLNFGLLDKESNFGNYNAASITNDAINQESLSLEIYQFILDNRILNKKVLFQTWNQRCDHQQQDVKIFDSEVLKTQGVFNGIGDKGQALIQKKDNTIEEIFSGSLTY